jgi:hypothetical protein
MTPEQIELARHALGLPNERQQSYRNRFVAGPGHDDYGTWLAIVDAGCATRRSGRRLPFGGDDFFSLTRFGAEAALKPGESLDPEDFPAPSDGGEQ